MILHVRSFYSVNEAKTLKESIESIRSDWRFYPDRKLGATNAIYVYGRSLFRHLVENKFDSWKSRDSYLKDTFTPEIEYLDVLRSKMSATLGGGVEYFSRLAHPGFQIVTEGTPRIWHYDDEKSRYPYDVEFPEYRGFDGFFDDLYTFTIMLSSGKFTYNYYPQTLSKYKSQPEYYCSKHHGLLGDECDCDLKTYETIEYEQGDMIIAKDRYLHRVGSSEYTSDRERITMQGQIAKKNNTYYLYW